MIPTLGGMSDARFPATEIQPILVFFSYLYLRSSGSAILVNTAADAMLAPQVAPNRAADPMVAINRPPRIFPIHLEAALKAAWAIPQLAASTDINMNKGTTAKVYVEEIE